MVLHVAEAWLARKTELRSVARRLRLIVVIQRICERVAGDDRYKEAFRDALHAAIRPGNMVLDVGANVVLYAQAFLEWVDPAGGIVAFEPAPESDPACRAEVHFRIFESRGRKQTPREIERRLRGRGLTMKWIDFIPPRSLPLSRTPSA